MADKIEIYEDESGGWRWRLIAGNNEIVADSAESYTRRADAERAAKRVFAATYAQSHPEDRSIVASRPPEPNRPASSY